MRKSKKLYLTGDQPRIRKKKRKWRSVIMWSALGLVALILIFLLAGYIWLRTKEGQMKDPEAEKELVKAEKKMPENTLILGIDKGSDPDDPGPGRSDTIMLVSMDKENKKALVFSIPRDTRVTISDSEGYHRINAAHSLGGAKLAIETIREFTGIPIHHFAVVDFEGFKEIVDSIGGVEMYLDKPINDQYAGSLPAGDLNLTGDQALVLMRARHDPVAVPGGDLDRVSNQQRFVRAMLEKVGRQKNIFRIKKIIDVASTNIKTDLSFTRILSLGREFNSLEPENIEMTLIPGSPQFLEGMWWFVVDQPAFEAMMERVREGEIAKSDERKEEARASVSVKVFNGTDRDGLARKVADSLTAKGYQVAGTGNTSDEYKITTIYYGEDNKSEAGKVAADIQESSSPVIERDDDITRKNGVRILVVLGMDCGN